MTDLAVGDYCICDGPEGPVRARITLIVRNDDGGISTMAVILDEPIGGDRFAVVAFEGPSTFERIYLQ